MAHPPDPPTSEIRDFLKNVVCRFAVAMAIASAWPLPALSQVTSGTLIGRITAEGGPVAHAQVVVTGASLPGVSHAFTDDHGRFTLPLLPAGGYAFRVSALGFRERRIDVVVQLGHTTDLGDLVLETEAIEIAGDEVTAAVPRLEPRSTAGGATLNVAAFRNLPADRDYQSIIGLLPQANTSFYGDRANLSGLTGAEAVYYVDGANVVEPPGNAVSTSLPYNLIREIEVRTSGYEAEFGGGGAVVNAVTASGGNQAHGQAFGFLANRLLSTHDGGLSLAPQVTGFGAFDGGIGAGGALRPDRLWYFLAYNPSVERQNVTEAGQGTLEDVRETHRFTAKLSWKPGDPSTITFSVIGDPSHREQAGGVVLRETRTLGNTDPFLGRQDGGGVTFGLRGTHVLGARTWSEWGLSRSDVRYSLMPRTERGRTEPLYIDERTGYVEGGFGSPVEREAGRTAVHGSVAAERGAHSVKLGAAYDDAFAKEAADIFTIRRSQDSVFTLYRLPHRETDNHTRVPAAFLQDSWRATRWLTVNLGVRWSAEDWITSSGDVGQHVGGEWQPRLGWVVRPGAGDRSRYFGSYGRFYQPTRLNVLQYSMQDTRGVYTITRYDHDPRANPAGGVLAGAVVLGRQAEDPDLRGTWFDEYQAGSERRLEGGVLVGVRGIYRRQREGIIGVISPLTGQPVFGNPGRGALAAYPRIDRLYRALEFTVEAAGTARLSWVWSSHRGNYEGYWDQSRGVNDPIGGGSFMPIPIAAPNAAGPLPNDRPHVIKLMVTRTFSRAWAAGATAQWQSGTPLSELGSTPFGPPFHIHLVPRGSAGRMPDLYDLSARLSCQLPARYGARTRLLADAYHIGNPRRAVFMDQLRYLEGSLSGVQASPNPGYGLPLALQPPVAYRLGIEADW